MTAYAGRMLRTLADRTSDLAIQAAEQGRFPDPLLRRGIRRMLRERIRQLEAGGPAARLARQQAFVESMRKGPVALLPEKANQQHYELPPAFFERVLGPRLKYSACLFPDAGMDLTQAEEAMLELSCRRAQLQDDMRVLDLGCGWGSLSFWILEHFRRCEVLAVSNATAQADWIRWRAAELGVGDRLEVVTSDIGVFDPGQRFDRVISVEMFEHTRNWQELLRRIAGWLKPEGRLFAHFFCHREEVYPYEVRGPRDWMAREFFSGGMMPSDGLILEFQDDLHVEARWRVDGLHYHRTCEAWLRNLDGCRGQLLPILTELHGEAQAARQLQRWRLFFLACSELFRFRRGDEWWVSHVRMAARAARA